MIDVGLPGEDGFALARWLREKSGRVGTTHQSKSKAGATAGCTCFSGQNPRRSGRNALLTIVLLTVAAAPDGSPIRRERARNK
jgi:hypothetical protein